MRKYNKFIWMALGMFLMMAMILVGLLISLTLNYPVEPNTIRGMSGAMVFALLFFGWTMVHSNPMYSERSIIPGDEFTHIERKYYLLIEHDGNEFHFSSFIAGQASKAMPLYAPRLHKRTTYYAFNIRKPTVELKLPIDNRWYSPE